MNSLLTWTGAHVAVSHSHRISSAGAAELGQRVVALAVPLFLALAAGLAARSPGHPHAPSTSHWTRQYTQRSTEREGGGKEGGRGREREKKTKEHAIFCHEDAFVQAMYYRL